MFNASKDLGSHADLRRTAEGMIIGGGAPKTHGRAIGPSSLSLLYKLAGDPATASDALKLLHELQVHQVELDLQQEHMIEESQALAKSASRMDELYVFAPVGYFMVSITGGIVEGNLVGARMLGVERADVDSINILSLVAPNSRPALLALLAQVHSSGLRHSCRVQALDTTKSQWLEVIASASPGGQQCLVVVMETDASDASPARMRPDLPADTA